MAAGGACVVPFVEAVDAMDAGFAVVVVTGAGAFVTTAVRASAAGAGIGLTKVFVATVGGNPAVF